MDHTVKVFVIPKERVPGGPPKPARQITVQALSVDGLLAAARGKLTADGFQVRSLSFGPQGLVAYVEER